MKKIEAINNAINEVKYISAKVISNAQSGHTGISLGAAKTLFTLYKDHLFFNPDKPDFYFRDRFVMSSGHGSALLYTVLKLFGYNYTNDDLKNFRKFGSKTPGHPELNKVFGIDCSTGPLGQGVANAVGLSIASNYLAAKFNKPGYSIFDNFVYCLCGDGDLMEGVALEAISLAGNLKLNNLILIYDKNNITLDGRLETSNSEDEKFKFYSQNWDIFEVPSPYGYEEISATIKVAKLKNSGKPKLIISSSIIGESSIYSDENLIHGSYLKDNELELLKDNLKVNINNFDFSTETKNIAKRTIDKNKEIYQEKIKQLNNYNLFYKDEYKQLFGDQTFDLEENIINFNEELSGRDASNKILNVLANNDFVVGGSADVASSTKAYIINGGYFNYKNYKGKNIRYGVREHAMSAISNGIALFGKLIPFASTFLSFSNYMYPAIRMTALMNLPVLYIFTHDSIIIGEDGPTHQPVEQLSQLRLIPNLNVYRPCCYKELFYCYKDFINNKKPTCLILNKEVMPALNVNDNVNKGIYCISKLTNNKPAIKIFATGYEIKLALETQEFLENNNIITEVYSAVNLTNFDNQPKTYKEDIFDNESLKVIIEAGSDVNWYKYISKNDVVICNNNYGISGSPKDVYKNFGFTTNNIIKQIYNAIENK